MGILDFLDNIANRGSRVVKGAVNQVNPFDNGKSWGNPVGPPRKRITPIGLDEVRRINTINMAIGKPQIRGAKVVDYSAPWMRRLQEMPLEQYRNPLPLYRSNLSDIDMGA